MRKTLQLISGVALLLGLAAVGAGVAAAQSPRFQFGPVEASNVVFVQTDNVSGNQVVAYDRAPNGTLAYSNDYALLFAVNAGTNTISVFRVRGDRLALQQVLSSGGTFPVSVAVHGDLVYVLNALNGGSVQGYRIVLGLVLPIFGSNRALGLDPTETPQFTHTPGQLAFTPDGSQLVVTAKANGNDIDVFGVDIAGQLSAAPLVNAEPGTVPFAVTFDAAGHLVVAEAGTNSLATFSLSPSGVATEIDALGSGQAATCWVAAVNGDFYASNAGSATVSEFQDTDTGLLSLAGASATDPGTVDAAGTASGTFLCVQTGERDRGRVPDRDGRFAHRDRLGRRGRSRRRQRDRSLLSLRHRTSRPRRASSGAGPAARRRTPQYLDPSARPKCRITGSRS